MGIIDRFRSWQAGSQPLVMPIAGAYVHWGWQQPMAGRRWIVEIRTEAPPGVGQYLAFENGRIDGAGYYLGIQTDMFQPGQGTAGPGVIFSSWATRTADTVQVAPGGFAEIGDHEDGFVGVRLPLRVHPGTWSFALDRREPTGPGDRFALTVTAPDGATIDAGSIIFPRARPDVPATIGSDGTGFYELYHGATAAEQVPRWELGIMAFDPDGGRCPAGAVSYPVFPDRPPFTAVDAWLDAGSALVEVRAGAGVRTDHPAGTWA